MEFWHEEIRGNENSEFALDDFGFVRQAKNELLRLVRRKSAVWEWQVHGVISNMLGKLLMSRNLLIPPHSEFPALYVRVLNAIAGNPLRD